MQHRLYAALAIVGLAAAALWWSAGVAAGARAARPAAHSAPIVVSINPCVDAILYHVADASQIRAISHYSQDVQATSVPLAWAKQFPATQGSAEEVLALKPDIVIAGAHVAKPTLLMLERLGIRVVQAPVPMSIEESMAQISMIAAQLGHAERGVALNTAITQALKQAASQDRLQVPALIWQAGGMVPGKGTVADELLTLTGFRNASADYGLQMWDVLPLERLLNAPPKLLLTSIGAAEREDRTLRHPAVRALGKRIKLRDFAPGLLHCAGPTLIPAAQRLAALRREGAL